MDDKSPMHLWDRMLWQAKLTLKLLRQSRLVPTISEYEYLYGPHDFNTEPLSPLVCAVEIHVKWTHRNKFSPHLVPGLYVGTHQEQYIYHKVWVKDTKSVRIAYTVFLKNKYLTNPTITTDDAIVKSSDYIEFSLQNNISQTNKS